MTQNPPSNQTAIINKFARIFSVYYKYILALSDIKIMFALAAFVWILRIAALETYPAPEAYIHDEQANMLGAQTFALGRLSNPPSLFPNLLREVYVLPEPNRMMKYQPATAIFMATGIKIFGHAQWGVVLCVSLMIMVCYWAICAWVSKPIALAVSLILIAIFRAPHYWIDSYWGGGPAALASFLILGAYAHIFIHKKFQYIWLGMLGIALVAISRPLEGGVLIVCLMITAITTFLYNFSRQEKKQCIKAFWLPILIVGGLYGSMQLYYNYKVTGDALILPYTKYDQDYGVQAYTIFNAPEKKINTTNYVLYELQKRELRFHENYSLSAKLIALALIFCNLLTTERLYFFPLIILAIAVFGGCIYYLPIANAFRLYRNNRAGFIYNSPLYLSYIVLILLFMVTIWQLAHYLAPFFAVFVIIMSRIFLCYWVDKRTTNKRKQHIFTGFFCVLLALFLGTSDNYVAKTISHLKNKSSIANALLLMPDKDIIFIDQKNEYKKGEIDQNWVYNEPNIETTPIIWAWYLSPKENQPLIDHYKGRKLWYIEPDKMDHVIPYDDYVKSLK